MKFALLLLLTSILVLEVAVTTTTSQNKVNRRNVVLSQNPFRNASSPITPMQVGNGDFAFGADVTGLQTFQPFNILSSWCWHNSSLPTTPGQQTPDAFTGLDWWTHGRLVSYAQPNPAQADISQWLIRNPHRVNLARIGFAFYSSSSLATNSSRVLLNVTETELTEKEQTLDLWSGVITSKFKWRDTSVSVKTIVDPHRDVVAVQVESALFLRRELAVFIDYPYMTGANKFEAPYVGNWDAVDNHTTILNTLSQNSAEIQHTLDSTIYFTRIEWEGDWSISGPLNSPHRYTVQPNGQSDKLSMTVAFSPEKSSQNPAFDDALSSSLSWWESYWESGAFLDLTSTSGPEAKELQRRTILSQYLLAVNGAGRDPPQESGLTNNGWYGKFHLEMVLWHHAHWAVWDKWDLLGRSTDVYKRFLASSVGRARQQGYDSGARWGKMSDPTGRSAPGEINSLLIWQQPHPLYFAELAYRNSPSFQTLNDWDEVVTETANFMASYAFWNETTNVFDLGPPMYPASENTNPNATINPTFELAYWRFGLSIASKWKTRQGKPVPSAWTKVVSNLAMLPVEDDVYVHYEGVPNMWQNPTLTEDHPALLAIIGVLPPTAGVNATILRNTVARVYQTWNFSASYGWDFPLLAMTAGRLGDVDNVVRWLLDEKFSFDDVGMPIGGTRVPTPYFPASAGFLWAVGCLAVGWEEEGAIGARFPSNWTIRADGFDPCM